MAAPRQGTLKGFCEWLFPLQKHWNLRWKVQKLEGWKVPWKVQKHWNLLDEFDSFVTAVLVSRLEKTTAREWWKYSNGMEGISPYTKLLKYIDLQACFGLDGAPEAGK